MEAARRRLYATILSTLRVCADWPPATLVTWYDQIYSDSASLRDETR